MKTPRPPQQQVRLAATLERAEFLVAANRLGEAHSAYLEALRLDDGYAARCEYGTFLVRLECYDQAAHQFHLLLDEARATGDLYLLSAAANNLAGVCRQRGDHDRARRLQQQAIQAEGLLSEQQVETSPVVLANRANDAILAGELHLAEILLRRSLALETQSGCLEGQADDWGNLGVVALLQERFDHAILFLWRAYHLHVRAGAHGRLGTDLLNLGEVYCRRELWQTAVGCFRQATRRFEQAGAWRSVRQANAQLQRAEGLVAGKGDAPPND